MRAYEITINSKKLVLEAPTWWHAYRTCMAGRTTMPRKFNIKPV